MAKDKAPNSVTVDGIKYVREVPNDSPIKIVVLQRGWVVVGRLTTGSDECVLHDASVIRVWGTTKGLGELTAGPTSKTIIDHAGTVKYHPLTAILTIDCEEESWQSHL